MRNRKKWIIGAGLALGLAGLGGLVLIGLRHKALQAPQAGSPHEERTQGAKNSVARASSKAQARAPASAPVEPAADRRPASTSGSPDLISAPLVRRAMPPIYHNAEVLHSVESAADSEGKFKRVQLLKTSFKYPLVEMEEFAERDPRTGEESVSHRSTRVADHVLVRLQEGYTREDLVDYVLQNQAKIRKEMPLSGIFLVSFEAREAGTLDRMIDRFKSSRMIRIAEPDFIVSPR